MEKPIREVLKELDAEVASLVERYLRAQTVSRSSFCETVTGNAYQSVRMRDQILSGFRRSDEKLFAGLPISGARFVDLGCNLGEKTRLAVRAGARYAEGVEYEEFFVRIGGLVNVYNRISNIVLRQGDLAKPGCLTEEFDVGASFSSFIYLEQNLEETVARISKLLIVETHALAEGWFDGYVGRVSKLMPHWILYGFADHGRGHTETKRAHIAFARERGMAEQIPLERAEALDTTEGYVVWLDVAASKWAESFWGQRDEARAIFRDLRDAMRDASDMSDATLARAFRDVAARLRALSGDVAYDAREMHFGSDPYWLAFFEGLASFIETGLMLPENAYTLYLRAMSKAGLYDAGMQFFLEDAGRAAERLAPRFRAFLGALRTKLLPNPIVVYNPLARVTLERRGHVPLRGHRHEEVTTAMGEAYRVQFIDGNHRFAALWLAGAAHCPAIFCWTNVFGLSSHEYALWAEPETQKTAMAGLIDETVLRLQFGSNPAECQAAIREQVA